MVNASPTIYSHFDPSVLSKMSFESSLIAALNASSVSVSDFVKRFAAKDFGLMPVFANDAAYGGQYPRVSRQLYNCLCVCVSWQMVDDLLAKQSQAWLTSGKFQTVNLRSSRRFIVGRATCLMRCSAGRCSRMSLTLRMPQTNASARLTRKPKCHQIRRNSVRSRRILRLTRMPSENALVASISSDHVCAIHFVRQGCVQSII